MKSNICPLNCRDYQWGGMCKHINNHSCDSHAWKCEEHGMVGTEGAHCHCGYPHEDLMQERKPLTDREAAHLGVDSRTFQPVKKEWKIYTQYLRDMHSAPFHEAICPHGIGHHKGIHGCDGCCATWPKEIEEKVSND